MTMTELDQELKRLRGSVLFDDEPVRALYRAALARAEANEADNQRLTTETRQLTARVAILKAQLAALQHAACPHCGRTLTGQTLAPFGHDGAEETTGEWRPVTESEPAEEQDVELIAVGYRGYDGKWYYRGDSPLRGGRPLPPPAAPQEPQP